MKVFDLLNPKNDSIRLLSRKDWKHEAPAEAFRVAKEIEAEGKSATIGHHDDYGFYVMLNETGTRVMYAENETLYDLNRVAEQH